MTACCLPVPDLSGKLRRCVRFVLWPLLLFAVNAGAQLARDEVPLEVEHRTVHVFRSAIGDISAVERAEAARQHIARALEGEGEGWTSIKPLDDGFIVELDGKPMFTVTAEDALPLSGESADQLANQASRVLQKVWGESRERRDPNAVLFAVLRVFVAFVIMCVLLAVLFNLSRWLRRRVIAHIRVRVQSLAESGLGSRLASSAIGASARACLVLTWLLDLLLIFAFSAYSLSQFPMTRPVGEELRHSFGQMLAEGLGAAAAALPELFIALIIFLLARVATQVSRALFEQVAAGHVGLGSIDGHTAPATRQIVNAAIWLFALAMAYPYLPGSETEAFRGLSVLLGFMVSIGAAGLVGQVASGLILVYTRSLLVGEYVRIQDSEGTVTHIGRFVTRLRTGSGEEIVLPNALVVGNVTRNFSRSGSAGSLLETGITIGYDAPWRQVHAMLLEAAAATPGLLRDPPPFVLQKALSDFYVAYSLVTHVASGEDGKRAEVASALHAMIQDVFNRNGVQIMSPHYRGDPAQAKIVAPADWHPGAAPQEPARR
jgi:small-conductance mechanosensitive channel